MKSFPRILLAFSALLLAVGAWMHASAFKKISSSLADSNLVPFAANSLKTLWLADSAASILVASIFAFVAIRPSAAMRWIIVLVALIPATTAFFIYTFIGSFIGGHVLMISAIAAIAGGLQYPGSRQN